MRCWSLKMVLVLFLVMAVVLSRADDQHAHSFEQLCKSVSVSVLKSWESAQEQLLHCVIVNMDPAPIVERLDDEKGEQQEQRAVHVIQDFCMTSVRSLGECVSEFVSASHRCISRSPTSPSHSRREGVDDEGEYWRLDAMESMMNAFDNFVCNHNDNYNHALDFVMSGGFACIGDRRHALASCMNHTEEDEGTLVDLLAFKTNFCRKLYRLHSCSRSELRSCERPSKQIQQLLKAMVSVTPCQDYFSESAFSGCAQGHSMKVLLAAATILLLNVL